MYSDQRAEGVGNIACWGFSPAISLPRKLYEISNSKQKGAVDSMFTRFQSIMSIFSWLDAVIHGTL